MKKIFVVFVLVLMFITTGIIFSSPAPDFDRVADFDITLKKLNKMISDNNISEVENKYLILNGALSSFSVTNKDPENYTVELLLVNGEWEGVSDVYIFRSVIILKGAEYKEMFPARRKRNPAPSEIPLNSGLIIVAKLNSVTNMGGVAVPVLDGYYIRVYQ